jgi:hypothetical protein
MNAGPDVERLISDWLAEEAPARAPDRILETAVQRSAHTRQRRFGAVRRTFPDMKISWQLAAAAVVGILVIALGAAYFGRSPTAGVGGPAATPLATPTPTPWAPATVPPSPWPTVPPLTQTFTSNLHGYSVKYPAGWTATQATAGWPAGTELIWGDAGFDRLIDAAELQNATVRFSGTSQPLAAGQSVEAWIRALGGDPSASPKIAVGDLTGYLTFDEGPVTAAGKLAPGEHAFDVVVVVDGRGYEFSLDGYLGRDDLAAMMATVVFDPASAVDPTAAP